MKRNPSGNGGTVLRILRYSKNQLVWLLLSVLLSVIYVFVSLFVPVLTGDVLDLLIGPGRVAFEEVVPNLILMGIMIAIGAASRFLSGTFSNRMTYGILKNVRDDAFAKLQKLPVSYADSHSHGDLVSRMIADADTFADGVLIGFTQLVMGAATIVGTLIFMFAINPLSALVILLLTPASLFLAGFISRRTQTFFRQQSVLRGKQTGQINRIVGEHKLVMAFGKESEEQQSFEETNRELTQVYRKATFYSSLVNPTTRLINASIYAAVALVGSLSVAGGAALTIGQLTCFLSYSNLYAKQFNEIAGVFAELQNALVCARRVFDVLDEPEETPDSDEAIVLHGVDGFVRMEHVDFSYTPERELIRDLDLSVSPGQRVAIVGPTGCGKTTLINLLMRFYDVSGGAVLLDGTDIRSVTRASLRGQYGMVLQDTWLRSGTVWDNITYGKPDATEEEVIAACKTSHCHDFIMRLPNGYRTVLSENGGNLSQGQKQLLCIARVMLALPPMLILDEATSSIDTRTELKVQNAFAAMMNGRTSFIVAHRLPTIKEADVILVMKDGRIIEKGTHRELLERGGFYRQLYMSQFQGMESEPIA